MLTDIEIKLAKRKWWDQRQSARRRGIEFDFSFESWLQFWLDSGHWYQRGIKSADSYVMSRFNDTGPYRLDNVVIKSNRDNAQEGNIGIKKPLGHGANVSRALKGISKPGPINGYAKISCIRCKKITGINIFHRHYNACIKKAPRRVL